LVTVPKLLVTCYYPTPYRGVNAVSFVIVKHILENFDNFWQVK